ncbi:MAG TPA: beta-galactosidase [Thermomicrobiales bacterium]|nr:beta-galactosidase [Thermomicrobiales bacterium]
MKRPPLAALGVAAAGALMAPIAAEVRVKRAVRPLTDRWRRTPVAPRGATLLGVSFRPRQAEALGLDARAALDTLLAYPFQLVRLGAYWNRIEPGPGRFVPDELDRQVDAAERAGKRIILGVGAVKTFGYPEFFVPAHHLARPLREGRRVEPAAHRALLAAATAFVARVVERYRERPAIVAWQVEHEAVDPLGLEHSWRLAAGFVAAEVAAVRAADPTRPVLLNGFLPTSLPVRLQQWWRTRDQGDSLAVALRLADIVGVDYYPRHALARVGPATLYLDGGGSPWQQGRRRALFARASARGRRVMVTEGQAEPWEAVTTPPDPPGGAMYSCPPERVIENYNRCLGWAEPGPAGLYAYLFWGAEYWLLRRQHGDDRYLQAFARILDHA